MLKLLNNIVVERIDSMKNYSHDWELENLGYVEMPESEYTESMKDMKSYIDILAKVVVEAKCGWHDVKYKVMKRAVGGNSEYMVLCVDGRGIRYIPISGNSKGCNLAVLGENLW